MKLCVDCQHFRKSWLGADLGMCNGNPAIDLVTGRTKQHFAGNARSFVHMCGEHAKWFSPRRQSWLERLIRC